MGVFETNLGVRAVNGGGQVTWVNALVDTGATYTVLPASMLRDRLGISPIEEKVFEYGDGTIVRLPIGQVRLSIDGRELVNVVVFCEEDQYLLGATSLQTFGLIPDTTNHRLIPLEALPL